MKNEKRKRKEKAMREFRPQRILCPTDYSRWATRALQYARVIAERFQAEIVLLYAETLQPPPYFTAEQEKELVKSLERSRQAAEGQLRHYARTHLGDGVQPETLVLDQPAVSAILATAESKKADLIVMGTQGRGGLSRLMLGSVTERVLRETDCAVLTVRFKRSEGPDDPVSIKKVLCPVNYTEVARQALEQAATVAGLFQAELKVLHVSESASGEESVNAVQKALCDWIPGKVRPLCNLQEMVRSGDAGEQIIDAALSHGCDLIVMGAQHKRFSDSTVIGTTTTRVTQHAPCPVWVSVRK